MPLRVSLSNFTQQQLLVGVIQFVHDQSSQAPSYNMTVRSSGVAWIGPYPANITFNLLQIKTNQLIVNQGQSVMISSENLSAIDTAQVEPSLEFIISNLQQGRFELISAPGQAIMTFSQQVIGDSQVRFIHDGTASAPRYQVTVSNGLIMTVPQAAAINFDAMPVLLTNRLVINQGQTLVLTSADLSATHLTVDDAELQFDISTVQQGQFSWINSPQNPLISFYQQNVTNGRVQFIHDNSIFAPGFNVTVTDGRASSFSQATQIDFDAIPVLLHNTLRINQGETVLITGEILNATHATGDDSVLLFNVTDLVHGQFNWINSPNNPLMNFYQQNISDSQLQFVHDDSTIAPNYIIVVTDGRTCSAPQSAQVDFDAIPVLLNNQLRINQGDTVLVTPEILSATHPTNTDDGALLFNLDDGDSWSILLAEFSCKFFI